MRFLLGLIVGCGLTVGGAYVADNSRSAAQPMVNWDVVARNLDTAIAVAKEQWKKFAG